MSTTSKFGNKIQIFNIFNIYTCIKKISINTLLQQSYPSFWPESRHPKKYGPVFTIEHISHHHYTNIKTWIFRINKKVIIYAVINFIILDVNSYNNINKILLKMDNLYQ